MMVQARHPSLILGGKSRVAKCVISGDLEGDLERIRRLISLLSFPDPKNVEEQMQKISNIYLDSKTRRWFRDKANPGNTFDINGMSGGQVDALITLWGASVGGIVLLDEPGQNLGSHEREILRDVLCGYEVRSLPGALEH